MSEQTPEEIAAQSPPEELGDSIAIPEDDAPEVTEDDLEDDEETTANTMAEPAPESLPADCEDPDLPEGSYDEFDGAVTDDNEPDGIAQPDDPFSAQGPAA